MIRELEFKIKEESANHCVVGLDNYKYEWVDETIPYNQLHDWIDLTLVASVDGVTAVDPLLGTTES